MNCCLIDRLSVKEGLCVDINGNSKETVNKMSTYVDVSVTNKTTSSASIVINFNEKRGALQELSLNKVSTRLSTLLKNMYLEDYVIVAIVGNCAVVLTCVLFVGTQSSQTSGRMGKTSHKGWRIETISYENHCHKI